MTGLLTRELGGRRGAQLLAATSIAVAAVVDGAAHTLNTTVFGLVAWALLCWLIVRILRTGSERLWLAVGVVAGVGLLDTDLVAFLMFAVVVGLAVAGPRRAFSSPWLYAGGAVALVMWAPYLAWQANHGWPELTVARSIANGGSGTSAPRWLILPEQLELVSLFLSPVWIVGLVVLLRDPALRWCRALGVAYLVLAIAFIVTGGKPYYLAGMFPLLLAVGARPVLRWMRRGRASARRALLIAAVVLSLTSLPVTLPLVPVGDVHETPIVKLNYDAGETIGWPTYVREIANVYASLPAQQRRTTVVLASNYGEAGAVDHYGPADGLPAVYSGHMAYWYWGPPPGSTTTAVAVGFERSDPRRVLRHAAPRYPPQQPPRRQRRRAERTGLGVLRSARALDEDLADAAPLRVSGRGRLLRIGLIRERAPRPTRRRHFRRRRGRRSAQFRERSAASILRRLPLADQPRAHRTQILLIRMKPRAALAPRQVGIAIARVADGQEGNHEEHQAAPGRFHRDIKE